MTGKLRADGATIHYETWVPDMPSAKWVTLVNGFSRPLGDFRAMARVLAEAGFSVLAFDNRGAGETETTHEFSLAEAAHDIGRLWEKLGISASALLGISLGGTLAMTEAVTVPGNLKGLILCSTSPRWDRVKITREPEEYFSPKFVASHEILVKSLIKEISRITEDPKKNLGAEMQRRAMGTFDLTPALSRVNVPTLILHGTEDRIVAPEAAKRTAGLIPHSTLEYFEGIGHLFLAECPKRFYTRVLEFLNQEVFPQ